MHTVNLQFPFLAAHGATEHTMADTYVLPSYPLLRFIAAHGMKFVAPIAAFVLLCGMALAVDLQSWVAGLASVLVAAVLGALLASYVEMVRVIVDTLVPR